MRLALGMLWATTVSATPPPSTDAWVTAPHGTDWPALLGADAGFSEGHRVDDDGEHLRITASTAALARLRDAGLRVHVETSGAPSRQGYQLLDDGLAQLRFLAQSTQRAGLQQWGRSVEDEPILAVWMGQPPESGAPAVRVLGAHHGDESSSFEVALDIAQTLLDDDRSDDATTQLLDTHTVWVVPYVNPDGVRVFTRQNARGVDLNRNYGVQWSASAYQSGDAPFSEPEARAVRDAAWLSPPHTSLSLHSGATNIGYVWNHTYTATLEETLLVDLGDLYGDRVTDRAFYVTNGADWYPSHGDTNDWSYGTYGGLDFTVELTVLKTPSESQIPVFLDAHREAVLAVLTRTPELTGQVVDAVSGVPVSAELTMTHDGVDISAGFVTNPLSGRFARPMASRSAVLVASAPGYQTTRQDVQTGQAAIVSLQPVSVEQTSRRVALPGESVTLPADIGPVVRLERGGEQHILSAEDDTAVLPVDIASGPWTLVASDGRAWPRAVFVSSDAPAAEVASVEDDRLVVVGTDLADGPLAMALVGGTPVALPLLRSESGVAEWAMSGVPATVDVWIHASGTDALFSVTHDPVSDTDTRLDTAVTPFRLERSGCGCAAGPSPSGYAGGLSALIVLLLAARRRLS